MANDRYVVVDMGTSKVLMYGDDMEKIKSDVQRHMNCSCHGDESYWVDAKHVAIFQRVAKIIRETHVVIKVEE